ncbi:MAG: DUF4384 domain-containing protein [Pirellulales bacterium]|nr:DUF4384 domain-containing protein [Pirellulales bacterium]
MRWNLLLVISLGMIAGPSLVFAAVDEGIARHIPWSGYWWPIAKGELLGPLQKYDTLTGKRAFRWELEHNPPGPQVSEWHGYCHGWAAAAIMEKEPSLQRRASGLDGRGSALLNIGDQKGWYSVSHAYDVANNYGERYGDGEGSEDIHDMAPDMLWRLLKMFLKEHRLPIVMDLEAGEEVWNYPVFAYRIDYDPDARGGGWYSGELKLWAADDAVPPEFVGTVPYLQTYTFVFQMLNGAVVLGSGRWTGQSAWNHPDFAWYPYVAVAENPEIQYETLKQLINQSTPHGQPSTPDPAEGLHVMTGNPTGDSSGKTEINQPGKEDTRKDRKHPTDQNPLETIDPRQPAGPELNQMETATHREDYIPDTGRLPVQAWIRQDGEPGIGSKIDPAIPLAISPMQLIAAIAEKTSHFGLDARLSEFGKVHYLAGERSFVTGTSERAGYLYVLHVSPAGDLALLHPAPGEDNRIEAGVPFHVPSGPQGNFSMLTPYGNHRIKVLVSQRPLILTGLDRRAPIGSADALDPAGSLAEQESQKPAGRTVERPGTWQGYAFRFLPMQARQIRELLMDYVQSKQLEAERFDRIDVKQILASFAQDEITYYVGPKSESKP